ncbi:hypothetical protein [Streptomyces odontomachi]|uniref:hypothetical protein n=1 Tax=Streptomyces odontomachi TaxID=2944940 RepID=UPI0021095AAF|nr:hypothetical protein [Streptomyces sp. ODS25]
MTTAVHALARRVATAFSVAGLAAGLALVAPATAEADPGVTVSCESVGQMRFSPGVQLFPLPQHIMFDGQTGTCDDNSGVGIRAASLSADFKGVVISCEAGGFDTGSGTGTITWVLEDGSVVQSTVELEFSHNVGPLVAISGTITSGLFTGHTFSSSYTTDLFGGAGKCTLHIPFGGFKEATFEGQFSID